MIHAKTITLYCFPYSGGGASVYRNWQADLPVGVRIRAYQLPGREDRLDEKPFESFSDLMEHLHEVLLPFVSTPYALFGHSVGAMVAFELARAIRRRGERPPTNLLVSGTNAPQTMRFSPPFVYQLPDVELLDYLKKLGGPDEFFYDPELQKVFLPLLRADFKVAESYCYHHEPPLDCPISVWGSPDDTLTNLDGLAAWREQTTSDFRLRIVSGTHYFVNTARKELLAGLSEELSSSLDGNAA